jgi:acyl carrier protein
MKTTREQIRGRIAEIIGQPLDRVQDQAQLANLVTSSFLLVELIIDLQDEFEARFGQAEMQDVKNVGQLLDLYTGFNSTQDKSV